MLSIGGESRNREPCARSSRESCRSGSGNGWASGLTGVAVGTAVGAIVGVGVEIWVADGDGWAGLGVALAPVVWLGGTGSELAQPAVTTAAVRSVTRNLRQRSLVSLSGLESFKESRYASQGVAVVRDKDDDTVGLDRHQPGVTIQVGAELLGAFRIQPCGGAVFD